MPYPIGISQEVRNRGLVCRQATLIVIGVTCFVVVLTLVISVWRNRADREALRSGLQASSVQDRIEAIREIARQRFEELIPDLLQVPGRHPEQDVLHGVEVVAAIEMFGGSAVQRLEAELRDDDVCVRRWAGRCLAKLGHQAQSALPSILRQLNAESDVDVRTVLIGAVSDIGITAQAASGFARLGARFVEERLFTSESEAVTFFLAVGPVAGETLARALSSGAPETRRIAARSLSGIEVESGLVHAAILRAVSDPDRFVQIFAIGAIRTSEISPDLAVPTLTRALDDHDPLIRSACASVLGKFGEQASASLPKLREIAANDVDSIVREDALKAIQSIDNLLPK